MNSLDKIKIKHAASCWTPSSCSAQASRSLNASQRNSIRLFHHSLNLLYLWTQNSNHELPLRLRSLTPRQTVRMPGWSDLVAKNSRHTALFGTITTRFIQAKGLSLRTKKKVNFVQQSSPFSFTSRPSQTKNSDVRPQTRGVSGAQRSQRDHYQSQESLVPFAYLTFFRLISAFGLSSALSMTRPELSVPSTAFCVFPR